MSLISEANVTAVPFNADPTGVADSAPAIQAAINSLGPAGGRVIIPQGHYLLASGIIIPGNVTVQGYGRFATILTSNGADITLVTLAGNYCGLKDVSVLGKSSGSPVHQAVQINAIIGFVVEHVCAWGGSWGINDSGGIDGTFYDVFPSGITGALQSINGANKYQSCKFDTGAMPSQAFGIYFLGTTGSGLIENSFDQCDFSGNFPSGCVIINDSGAPQSIAKFTDCIFGGSINLIRAQAVMFSACEMPPANEFGLGAGVGCSITGSYSLGGSQTYPACAKAGNININ